MRYEGSNCSNHKIIKSTVKINKSFMYSQREISRMPQKNILKKIAFLPRKYQISLLFAFKLIFLTKCRHYRRVKAKE